MPNNTALTPETRYLYGETSPIDATFVANGAFKIGDIVCLNAGVVNPASDETTLANAAGKFLGISGQAKEAGAVQIRGNSRQYRIRIDTDGVFAIPCADACVVGDLVGPKLNGGKATAQEVIKTATAAESIGVVVEDKTASDTHVKVRIISKKGGLRAN